MALNYIWIAFFLIAFVVALFRLIFLGDLQVFPEMVQGVFDMSKTAFEISLGLTGVLAFWMGIMKVGEKGGIISIFSRLIDPLFRRLFPDLGKNHPAGGSIMMNIAANMLGLDNAATPMGLKAMEQMQATNPNKDQASNSQIMFLVLNTSGLTIIPVAVMVYRAQMGAADPSDIFLPILLATFFSTLVGLITVAVYQRINLFDKVILAYIGTFGLLVGALLWYFSQLPPNKVSTYSSLISNIILFGIIAGFITLAAFRKVNVYEAFIDGAKDGFQIAVKIIPYLVAILVAIKVFRDSGALTFFTDGVGYGLKAVGLNTAFVEALPTAFMKPLSGTGARGMMIEAMETFGPDSFVARVASTIQGSTDTTFYVIAVYFGSVGIRNTRYAVTAGLIADLAGIVAAISIAYVFFY